MILSNFNHERWNMACMDFCSYFDFYSCHYTNTLCLGATIRLCRTIVEESLKWAHQRLVFGKRLIDEPVIRQK